MVRNVYMVGVVGQSHPVRVLADFFFVDNHHAMIFGNRTDEVNPAIGARWEPVASFSSSKWSYCRNVGTFHA